MNVLFKKAEEIGNKVFGTGAQAAPTEPPPISSGVAEIELSYEKERYKLHLDVAATAAAFSTQVYLATGVSPARQKIVGFKTAAGHAHPTPMLPDSDMRKLGVRNGMKLMLMQLPIGHELEPYHLTSHIVDKVASKCSTLQERVDAVEAILLVQRIDAGTPEAVSLASKLHKLCIVYDDIGLKLLLKIDEIDGDDNVKAARKALVRRVNALMDRLESLKRRLEPIVNPPDPTRSAGGSGASSAAAAAAAAAAGGGSPPAAAAASPPGDEEEPSSSALLGRLETPRPAGLNGAAAPAAGGGAASSSAAASVP